MKRCLTYMSRFWGADKFGLVLAFILLAFFEQNGLMLLWIIYAVNDMSLSMYGTYDTGVRLGAGSHERLTLSLPMSRKTIYDTRMYITGFLYISALVMSIVPFVRNGHYFSYLMSAALLLFGHIICGLCIRKPNLRVLSGVPAVILLMLVMACEFAPGLENIYTHIEYSRTAVIVEAGLCAALLAVDIFIWAWERQIFIKGSHKGNAIRKNDKSYEMKKERTPRILYVLIPFGAIVCIVQLLLPILLVVFFMMWGVFSEVEVHDDVNDYLKYHTGEQAEEAYQIKWDMDESIWPAEITDDMNVEDYKMVYYDPWDAQFLGYLAVSYDKESYAKEVMRLKDYQSTDYIGYYGVTGFDDYELLAMYADSYQGFVYALTDGKDKIIYVEIIFCNRFMDLAYEKYIPGDYLPEGFNAHMDNPYQKKWEKENGIR